MRRLRRLSWICLALAIAAPALADDHLYEVDEDVVFDLPTPEAATDYRIRVPEPGLLAFETDIETFKKLSIEVLAPDGTVIGQGGARVAARGEYTIRLRRRPAYATDWDGNGTGVLGFWTPDIDAFEPNDSTAAAAVLTLGEDQATAGGPVSLFPAGDEDHFVLRLARPGYVTPALSIPAFIEAGDGYQLIGPGEQGRQWQFGETRLLPAGDVSVLLRSAHPHPAAVGLRFDYLPNWDACEPNDQRDKACDITDGRAIAFSLFPSGDTDWFSFTVERPGAIALSLSGLPPTEYDPDGRVLRGLELRVRTRPIPGTGDSRYPGHMVTHGSVFIGAPNPGVYRFALAGRWLDANPDRAMSFRARAVDLSNADANSNFSIFGVYGTSVDDESAIELTVLADLGAGRFYPVTSAEDIAAAMGSTIGLADAPVDRTPPDQEPGEQRKPEPPPDPRLADKNPKLQKAVQKLRGDRADSKSVPPILDEKKRRAPTQQAAVPKSAEEIELDRLRALEKTLESTPEAALWRHHYAQPDGSVLKRLEPKETASLAGQSKLLKSEPLSPKMSRRLLNREIQQLE